jgi:hypothetical protein
MDGMRKKNDDPVHREQLVGGFSLHKINFSAVIPDESNSHPGKEKSDGHQ